MRMTNEQPRPSKTTPLNFSDDRVIQIMWEFRLADEAECKELVAEKWVVTSFRTKLGGGREYALKKARR